MRRKGLIALMTFCIAAGMMSGCASKESERRIRVRKAVLLQRRKWVIEKMIHLKNPK